MYRHLNYLLPFIKDNLNQLSDGEILEEVAESGNIELYYTLFERYQHLVYGQCRRYFADTADCKDMAMHIFEVMVRRVKPAEVKNFAALLSSITNNECISELRKRKSYQKHLNNFSDIKNQQSSIVENDGLLRLTSGLSDEQQQMILDSAIHRLKPAQRSTIKLFFLERKSYKEISDLTDLSDKEVKSNLQNGKRNLKILVESVLKQLNKTTGVSNENLKQILNENTI